MPLTLRVQHRARSSRMARGPGRVCATLLLLMVGSTPNARGVSAGGADLADVLIIPGPPNAAFERLQGQLIDLSVRILDPGAMPEPHPHR